MTTPTAPIPFSALLALAHADAVRVALADFDLQRDGRPSPHGDDAAVDCAIEFADDQGYTIETGQELVRYWLRCYSAIAAALFEQPAPFADGDRVVVVGEGLNAGRAGTVRHVDAGGANVALDPRTPGEKPFEVRWTRPATFCRWLDAAK